MLPLARDLPMKRCCVGEWEATSGAIELHGRSNGGLTERNIPREQTLQNSQRAWITLQRPKGCVFPDIYIPEMKDANGNEAGLWCTDQEYGHVKSFLPLFLHPVLKICVQQRRECIIYLFKCVLIIIKISLNLPDDRTISYQRDKQYASLETIRATYFINHAHPYHNS